MTANRECDYCPNVVPIHEDKTQEKELQKGWELSHGTICPDCRAKVGKPTMEAPPPISISEVLKTSRTTDASHQTSSDLFNANTTAIMEIKAAIDADASITNKPYALAEALKERINTFKRLIFEKSKEITDLNSNQANHQVYLNRLANTLRQDEREKLGILDINYKPRPVKIPVTQKTIRKAKARIDKTELRARAKDLGVSEFALQMIVVSKGLSVQAAYEMLKKNIESAKALATPPPPPVVVPVTPEPTVEKSILPGETVTVETDDEVVDMTGTENDN